MTSNRAIAIFGQGHLLGSKKPVHPNDDDEKDEAALIEEKAREAAALAERKPARKGGRPRKPDPE